MTEEQFEKFVRGAARDYNAAPHVPREEMWANIQEARHRRRMRRIIPLHSPHVRWGVGVAAALVLGIGIGMFVRGAGPSGELSIASANVADAIREADQDIYRLVTFEHLSRAEIFLTMFRSDVRAGQTDYEIADPARELLSANRLLQSSPAARDERLRELLGELELLLVQIAQLRAELGDEDAQLIAEGIEQRDVLLKLREAVPAVPGLPGVQGVL